MVNEMYHDGDDTLTNKRSNIEIIRGQHTTTTTSVKKDLIFFTHARGREKD